MRIKSLRYLSQIVFLFLSIIGIFGVAFTGLIFPYFFCNASPGAVCACPLWVLEHSAILFRLDFRPALAMLLYLFGFIGIIGYFVGRSFCGWACPIGFIQDIANRVRGKLKIPWYFLVVMLILGCLFIASVFLSSIFLGSSNETAYFEIPGIFKVELALIVGYLGTAGLVMIGIAIYGLYVMWGNFYGKIFGLISSIIFLINIRVNLWFEPGLREIYFLLGMVIFSVILLSILKKEVIETQRYVRDTKYYHQNKYYLIKYIIFIFIPITSILFMDKWFTNIDPIGGLTAGVPMLMYESDKWYVSDLLWVKFVFIAMFFWIIFITYRGFCRFICPVGAMISPLNKVSLQDIKYDQDNCTNCMRCIKSCPMKINILKMDQDMECIRCGRCIDACKDDALHMTMANKVIK